MNEYMIVIHFSMSFSEDFVSLIPKQRSQVNELLRIGILTSCSLSADRSMLWMIMLSTSKEEVEKTLKMMPLFRFMHYQISELMFHQAQINALPQFSLN